MNPADYPWPVPSPADTARALAGISGDITGAACRPSSTRP